MTCKMLMCRWFFAICFIASVDIACADYPSPNVAISSVSGNPEVIAQDLKDIKSALMLTQKFTMYIFAHVPKTGWVLIAKTNAPEKECERYMNNVVSIPYSDAQNWQLWTDLERRKRQGSTKDPFMLHSRDGTIPYPRTYLSKQRVQNIAVACVEEVRPARFSSFEKLVVDQMDNVKDSILRSEEINKIEELTSKNTALEQRIKLLEEHVLRTKQ
jgi:hypothetical protein